MTSTYGDFIAKVETGDLQGLVLVEDVMDFPTDGLIPKENRKIADDIIQRYGTYVKMDKSGIPCALSVLLGGEAGTGKTSLIRYIAHMMGLPLVTFRYSGLVGETAAATCHAISTVFQAVQDFPCVLCFDRIETFCTEMVSSEPNNSVEHISRTLAQELENMPNSVIFIATMDKPMIMAESDKKDEEAGYGKLSAPLSSRFGIVADTKPITSQEEIKEIYNEFFSLIGMEQGKRADKDNGKTPIFWLLGGCTLDATNLIRESNEHA